MDHLSTCFHMLNQKASSTAPSAVNAPGVALPAPGATSPRSRATAPSPLRRHCRCWAALEPPGIWVIFGQMTKDWTPHRSMAYHMWLWYINEYYIVLYDITIISSHLFPSWEAHVDGFVWVANLGSSGLYVSMHDWKKRKSRVKPNKTRRSQPKPIPSGKLT